MNIGQRKTGSEGNKPLHFAFGQVELSGGLLSRLPEKKKMALSGILVAGGLVVCTAYLVASTYNPFLYFRF